MPRYTKKSSFTKAALYLASIVVFINVATVFLEQPHSLALTLTKEQARKAGIDTSVNDANLIGNVLNATYTIVAIVAVVIIIVAGFMYITSEGDATKTATARKAIIYSLIGLVIVGSAFIITGIVQSIGTR